MKRILLLSGIGAVCIACPVHGQLPEREVNVRFSLPAVALLDVEPGTGSTLNFVLSPSAVSGTLPEMEETSGRTLWLNYSSALERNGSTRSIVAQVAGGSLPGGFSIVVETSAYQGDGRGTFGQPAGKVVLSDQPLTILSGVGNGYTGDGVGNGHMLTFTVEIDNYAELSATGEASFTILYTLSDH